MTTIADRLLRALAYALFKVCHDIRIQGAGHVPTSGAVILASNHPSYLDPAYILVGLRRPVRFLAWEKLFQVPVLGALMRRYGAIPVDTRKPGRASFESAVKVLRAGAAFGIFPEGGRSDFGVMNPFKSGVARLAMMTGAPIVPITIRGAFRVWPKYQLLPRPGYVQVVFHPPIRLDRAELAARHGGRPVEDHAAEVLRDRDYEKRIVDAVMEAINSSLLPSLRAEARGEALYGRARVPWSWDSDAVPYLFFLALGLHGRWSGGLTPPGLIVWGAVYTAYLALDAMLNPPGAWMKGLRSRAPWLLSGALTLEACGYTPAAWALVLGAYAGLVWYTSFRFQEFRRWRFGALLALYALLFLTLHRSL